MSCDRSSRTGVFCKKVLLKFFAKFTGKHLSQSLFFNKVPLKFFYHVSHSVVFLFHVEHQANANNLSPQSSSLRQKQKKQSTFSEEETGEISTVLRSMKKLATDIAAEQDLQLQQIDVLNKSVERANSQIKQTDSKVRKMT